MEPTNRIDCILCGARLKTKVIPPVGSRIKCPKCSGEFRYSPAPPKPQPVAQKPDPSAKSPPTPHPGKVSAQLAAAPKVQSQRSSGALWVVATLVGVVAIAGLIGTAWKFNLLGHPIAKNTPDVNEQTVPVDPIAAGQERNAAESVTENGEAIAGVAPQNEANQAGNAGLPEKFKLGENEWPLTQRR